MLVSELLGSFISRGQGGTSLAREHLGASSPLGKVRRAHRETLFLFLPEGGGLGA